jgi:signal peptidase I
MIVCTICGFRNPDTNDRCFRCQALLKRNEEAMQEAKASAARKTRRLRYAYPIAAPLDWLRHRPWLSGIFAVPDHGQYRYPFTAGLLSLLPGVGHWYAGQGIKGALVFMVWLALFVFALATIRQDWSNAVLFSLLMFWLLVWADSVAVAARANGDTWRFRKTLALVFGAMMIIGTSVSVGQYLGLGFVSLERVSNDAMQPAFRAGDRVFFTSVPLWIRDPAVGEIVSFDPPRFVATQKDDVYSINISRYFQRVVGAPGDRLVKKGNRYFRNGEELSAGQVPLGGDSLPDFDTVVPEGSYFIPVTGIPKDMLSGISGAGLISHVGQPGFIFQRWPDFAMIPEEEIRGKGIAILSPPPRRQWLK